MNTNHDPDTTMAAWLDDGPDQLPADTRRAIAVGVRAVPRRRSGISWPFATGRFLRPAPDLRRLSVAVVIVAVVAVVGAIAVSNLGNRAFRRQRCRPLQATGPEW